MKGIEINNELAKKIIENAKDHGSPNTMARKKLERKIRLYNKTTKRVYGPVLRFDDLKVGDVFCMYEYNGTPVLLDGKYKVMRVDSISVRGDRSLRDNLLLHIQPVIL